MMFPLFFVTLKVGPLTVIDKETPPESRVEPKPTRVNIRESEVCVHPNRPACITTSEWSLLKCKNIVVVFLIFLA